MGYSVFLHNFTPEKTRLQDVESVLLSYGQIGRGVAFHEFSPDCDDICDHAVLSTSDDCVEGITFERPVSGNRLRKIVYELLGLQGMCFFELDVSYVLSRSDVSEYVPDELIDACESGTVTVVSTESDLEGFI